MVMIFTLKKFTNLIFLTVLFLIEGFYQIIPGLKEILYPVENYYKYLLSVSLISIYWVGYFFVFKCKLTFDKNERNIFLLMLLMFITQIIYSSLKYNQSFFSVAVEMQRYLLLLFFLPCYIMLRKSGVSSYLKTLEFISFVWMIVILIKAFSYDVYNLDVFEDIAINGMRNERLRIYMSLVNVLAIQIALHFFLNRSKYRAYHLVVFLLGLFDIFYINQTRSLEVILIISIFYQLYCFYNKFTTRIYIIGSAIIALAGMFLSGLVGKFLRSFSVYNDTFGVSTLNRIDSYIYYIFMLLKNPIMGSGFIRTEDESLLSVKMGLEGINYISDVGIIGTVSEAGILILIITYLLFSRFWDSFKILKNQDNKLAYLIGSFSLTLVLCLINLSPWDWGRTLIIPIFMALTSHVIRKDHNTNIDK